MLGASIVVVAGPPGVGKSRLLREGIARSQESSTTQTASALIEVEHRSGSLQHALLGALGTALATAEADEDLATRWGRVLQDALARAADATAQDFIRGATMVMNGIVRERLGDTVGDALERFEAALTESIDQQLSRRIEAEADPGAIRAFCALAEQVRALIGRPLVLTLDRGERLSDEDFRLLLDLTELLPSGVHLNLGHTRARPADDERLRRLTANAPPGSFERLDLDGLDEDAVAQWMRDEGLEPDQEIGGLDELMKTTAGYPLQLDLAIRTLERGGRLADLTGDAALGALIEQNYADLTADDQRILTAVAAFSDPPDLDVLLTAIGLDAADWALRERRLVDARFLVTNVSGVPWFHELGRRLLWEAVLNDQQRKIAAEAVVRTGLAHAAASNRVRISTCVDLARLAPLAPGALESFTGATAVTALTTAQLAVLAATEELTGDGNPVASVGDIVNHARRRFPGSSGDLFDAAIELRDLGLGVIAENDQNQVFGVTWGSPAARAIAVGRIAEELGRIPINSLAAAILHSVILPRAETFHEATMGAGHASLTSLSREIRDRQYDRTDDHVSFNDRPGILLRPRLGALDLSGRITFADVEARDRMFAGLTDPSTPDRVFGEPWDLSEIYLWPQPEPVRERRFTSAAELLTGQNFVSALSGPTISSLHTPETYGEEMDLAVRTWGVIRRLATDLERSVLGLERPRGVGYFASSDGDGVVWSEIQGRSDVIEVEPPEAAWFGFSTWKAFDRGLGLGMEERITRMRARQITTPTNPVGELIGQTLRDLRAFNQSQRFTPRLRMTATEAALESAVVEALDRRQADAQAFVDAGIFAPPDRPLGTELVILGIPGPPDGPRFDVDSNQMLMGATPVDGPNRVQIRLSAERPEGLGWEFLEREFGFKIMGPGSTGTMTGLDSGIAHLLGYEYVTLDYSNVPD